MINFLYTMMIEALPIAIALFPALIALMVAAMAARMLVPVLPFDDGSRAMLLRIAGVAQAISIAVLGGFFAFMFITTNLTAWQAQRDFESFRAAESSR